MVDLYFRLISEATFKDLHMHTLSSSQLPFFLNLFKFCIFLEDSGYFRKETSGS